MRRDYLLQRPGSQNWRLRLQLDGRAVEQSLGTSDRALAEVRALPLIAAHKEKLLAKRPTLAPVWVHELKPGLHVVNGEQVFATDRELNYLDKSGTVTRTTPNGRSGLQFSGFTGHPLTVQNMSRDLREAFEPRPTVATKNGDDDLIELYLRERNITGAQEKQARDTWTLFRELCPGVKLANATRDDGRKLRDALKAKGNKSTTVMHKIAQLCAAVNFAIAEGKLRFNPFAAIASKGDDITRRVPFSVDDMKLILDNLDSLPAADQLLVRVLATTGMRLDEAFQTTREAKESGIRYVITGSKNDQSLRRVPLPAALLPYLKDAIKGPLFSGSSHNASSRLNPWLRRIGITSQEANTAKSVHSFRHRAQDRLRAAQCREDIRHAVLGHEKKTVAAGYGEGFPVTVLKKWIDRIGF